MLSRYEIKRLAIAVCLVATVILVGIILNYLSIPKTLSFLVMLSVVMFSCSVIFKTMILEDLED